MTDQYKNKYLWLYLAGFFVILILPLFSTPYLFFPPAWGKTIIFRIILSILISLFVYQILFQKEKFNIVLRRIRHSPARLSFWFLIALLGIYFLATLFSSDVYFSLWGSPYRASNFLNFSFYIIFAILALFIVRQKDWQKIWDLTIIIGILVSTVAIFQQLGLFSETLIPFSGRPPSTMGGPIFLALYLLLLSFLTLSFTLKEKKWLKKAFYFSSFLLFLYIILLTRSRAAYFGLFIGFFYFVFLYSINLVDSKRKTLFLLIKILIGLLLIVSAYGIYYLNNEPQLPDYLQESIKFQEFSRRLSIRSTLDDPRFSAWKVSIEAVKARPILGYGPENFSIGFDKYYDPSLPRINMAWGSWWDRAHNFLFDISVTAGIPALIIYLSLFASLFWGLQKVKKKRPEQALVCHGIQATFLAYLSANFFGFDTYSTYLISFLFISYSLYLISSNTTEETIEEPTKRTYFKLFKWRKPIFAFILIILIWFIWSGNIKPLGINTQINQAQSSVNNKKCTEAMEKMENILPQKSFIDSYLRLKYIEFMKECAGFYPEKNLEYAKKGVELLKESAEIRPKYTRTWIFLAAFTNILIEKEKSLKKREDLIKEAEYYFEKAQELSPKHQEILTEWAKTYLVAKDYEKMREKSQECLNLNLNIRSCYWYLGLSEIYLGQNKLAEEHLALVKAPNTLILLNQLITAYASVENFEKMAMVYQKLIKLNPEEPQYYASLAFVYRELGEYEKAKEQALIFLELKPEAKEEVEFFLQTLE